MCLVSIVIPYFNRGDVLPRALDSVCRQTFKDMEIILINDGSTDQSAEVVEEYIKTHQEIYFQHISQANKGPSGARNNGIRHAQGKYIAFLDSDDSWEPAKLATQIEYMERNPHIAITGTNYYVTERKWLRYPQEPAIVQTDFYHVLFKIFFWTSTIIIRREVFFTDNIWYREGKKRGEDHLLYLQILRKHQGSRFSQPLANMYKLEYGVEGLTQDIRKLLECDLDTLKIIYAENDGSDKKINLLLFLFLNFYLHLKHLKRMFRVGWYKWSH